MTAEHAISDKQDALESQIGAVFSSRFLSSTPSSNGDTPIQEQLPVHIQEMIDALKKLEQMYRTWMEQQHRHLSGAVQRTLTQMNEQIQGELSQVYHPKKEDEEPLPDASV